MADPKVRPPSVSGDVAASWAVPGADGLPLRVYRWRGATGRRPAVLWGHANGFAAGAYAPLLDELARSVDVYAADLRAHGGSADPGGDYDRALTADRLAIDLIAVTRAVHVDAPTRPLHFAAHSASGLGALRMGAVFGHAPFASMTLFEPPLAPTPDQPLHADAAMVASILSARAMKRRRSLPEPDAFAASLAGRDAFSRWRPDMLAAFVRATLTPDTADATGGGWRLACPPEAEAAVYRMTVDSSTFKALADFTAPVLFVESDPAMPGVAPSWATKAQGVAAAQAPRGRLERIVGASHMMPFERPEAVLQIILNQIAISCP